MGLSHGRSLKLDPYPSHGIIILTGNPLHGLGLLLCTVTFCWQTSTDSWVKSNLSSHIVFCSILGLIDGVDIFSSGGPSIYSTSLFSMFCLKHSTIFSCFYSTCERMLFLTTADIFVPDLLLFFLDLLCFDPFFVEVMVLIVSQPCVLGEAVNGSSW